MDGNSLIPSTGPPGLGTFGIRASRYDYSEPAVVGSGSGPTIFDAAVKLLQREFRLKREDAEDVAAEARLTLLRLHLDGVTGVGLWIKYSRFEALDALRRQAREVTVKEHSAEVGHTSDPLELLLVQEALSRLSELDREIIRQSALGATAKEISEATGAAEGGIRMRKSRIRKVLRSFFQREAGP